MSSAYNQYWLPSCYYDGGYIYNSGMSQSYVISGVTSSGEREVHPLGLDVSMEFLGSGQIEVIVTVTNEDFICVDTDGDEYGDPGHPENQCPDDNCWLIYNPDQEDIDQDSVGDSCDNCLTVYNPDQEDADQDLIGDSCDVCPDDPGNDDDQDGVCYADDNCPDVYNPDQWDTNGDGIGDACCCIGDAGNVDGDPGDNCNIVDLTQLVEFLFGEGDMPPCPLEANIDGDIDGTINIVDITQLTEYLFNQGDPPAECL